MAHLVWLQLDLFAHAPFSRFTGVEDSERDRRTGGQWIRSILSYLEFGSGDAWRRVTDRAQRESAERLWYLNGIREINRVRSVDPVAIPLQTHKNTTDTRAVKLCAKPRAALVAELMRVNPALTDRRILSHLPKTKLASMLLAARDSRASVKVCA